MRKDSYDSDLVIATCDLLTEQASRQISGDVAFYLDCAERFGSPILELGVGTGRIACALAKAGHKVVGLDRSRGMHDACVSGVPSPDREAVEPETGHILRRRSIKRINDPLNQAFEERRWSLKPDQRQVDEPIGGTAPVTQRRHFKPDIVRNLVTGIDLVGNSNR